MFATIRFRNANPAIKPSFHARFYTSCHPELVEGLMQKGLRQVIIDEFLVFGIAFPYNRPK